MASDADREPKADGSAAAPTDAPDPIPLSSLEHYSYCPRQCALIHIEQVWDENIYTLKGSMLHERVDLGQSEVEAGVRITRSLPLWSERLGLTGRADVVEFHGEVPYPVEYKSGPKDVGPHAAIQLCAQAMCLEEMLGRAVPAGALYQHAARRRTEVVFTEELRQAVVSTIQAVREMMEGAVGPDGKAHPPRPGGDAEQHGHPRPPLPAPVNDARCRRCSLRDSCLPQVVGEPVRIAALHRDLFVLDDEEAAGAPAEGPEEGRTA